VGLLGALGLWLGLWTGVASAQEGVTCRVETSVVRCGVALEGSFDADVRKRLRSGFLNTLLVRVYIRRVSDGEPVALTARRNLQVYELWDDVFYVYVGGSKENARPLPDLDSLVKAMAAFELAAAEGLPSGDYYADVIVELNPLSDAEEAEIRSWIARSRGGHRTFATGDRSFFGTFVSLFMNIRPGSAERTFRVQSPPFQVR